MDGYEADGWRNPWVGALMSLLPRGDDQIYHEAVREGHQCLWDRQKSPCLEPIDHD